VLRTHEVNAMTQAIRMSFEEYAALDAEDWLTLGLPEGRCEFWDGELIEVPTEAELNDWIAQYLFLVMAQSGMISPWLIRVHSCEVEVRGRPRTRFPDLVILEDEHISLTQRRLFIRLSMPTPRMVAEVVSPGKTNRDRDYKAKTEQYQDRGIPEFWLIDPQERSIAVLTLQNGGYLEATFAGSNLLQSPLLQSLNLQLSADQILSAGR